MKNLINLVLLMASVPLWAQEFPKEQNDVGELADELSGLPDADLNYEELYENLMQLFAVPLNLNSATVEDIRFMNVLTEAQINNLIEYRTDNGPFLSVYELQSIPDFDLPTIYKIAPFVTVTDPTSAINLSLVRRIKTESENYFLLRYERTLQSKNGFTNQPAQSSRFEGSPDKFYMRFRTSRPGDFSMGFTAEKDAGEAIRWDPRSGYYGADYLSGHIQIQNKGRLKNFIVGDFQGQFGQGIMLGGMFGTGKGGETITATRRSDIGLLPYTSVNEAGAMRGIGATVKAGERLFITGFYSSFKKDASLGNVDENEIISSFQLSGLHRNDKELAVRKSSGERNFGAVLQYKHQSISTGLMFNRIEFDVPVHRVPSAYNQFTFNGKSNQNIGVYANYTLRNCTVFSEVVRSLNGGYGATVGLLTTLAPKLDAALVYRKYERNFYSFYSSGFGEGSSSQNETGFYWGWKYTFNRRYGVSGYADFFRFPWLRFRAYAPSTGYEWLLRFSWEPSRKVKIFIQAREESKIRNVDDDDTNQYQTANGKKNNFWISVDYSSHPMLRLKSRVQFSTYAINKKSTQGIALMQDLIFDAAKFKITMRYGLFDTEDYDNRQYAYENDVWLAYSLPAYNGSGVRKIIIVQYKINKHLGLWIRYAHMRYRNQEFIGTAIDRIEGNIKNDIKAQVVVRF
jgi:hypothetical protein